MLKKAVITLGIIFVIALFVSTANISHKGARIPAAQPSSQAAPSQQETTKQAYDQGFNDALKSYDLMLKKPTYAQVLDFLATDNTSQLQSTADLQVNCLTLSTRFRDNALAKGLWSYVVIFNWHSGTSDIHGWHALNAFDTKDKGLVYIEPSGEKIVTLKLGEDYSKVFCSIGKFCPLESMIITQIGVVR